ncbi:unnamed protein product [Oikopleura dioica]|uniref:Uncharacterized protein n=1 Tax=Oikopleura dioica TaxID=34765 RepID=E4XRU9_OIKDI|nr:unnamed protein product [Oikopleura dioica]
MHESYSDYAYCRARERNKGLFVSTQKLKGRSAIFTRQNNDGSRYGLECPEERDYWPYWGRSSWKDIAILTDYQDCQKIFSSLNDYSGFCRVLDDKDLETLASEESQHKLPLTNEACDELTATTEIETKWESEKYTSKPFCGSPVPSRDNFHGDNGPGTLSKFKWTIPNDLPTNTPCTIRVRYNISTADYAISQDSQSTKLNMGPTYGLNGGERDYQLRGNPDVQIFKELPMIKNRLNINTAQFGRTFQDRTHSFVVKKPDVGNEIVDLTVTGKRGNPLEVYPNMYQAIHPNVLSVLKSALINLHWTGSNNNPQNSPGGSKIDLHGVKSSNSCLNEENLSFLNPSTSYSSLMSLKSTCYLKDFQSGENGIAVDALLYQTIGNCVKELSEKGACEVISEDVVKMLFPSAELGKDTATYFKINPNTVLNGSSFSKSDGEFSILSSNGKSWIRLLEGETLEAHSGIVSLRESSTSLTLGLSLSFTLFGILLLSGMLFYQRYKKTPWDESLLSQHE